MTMPETLLCFAYSQKPDSTPFFTQSISETEPFLGSNDDARNPFVFYLFTKAGLNTVLYSKHERNGAFHHPIPLTRKRLLHVFCVIHLYISSSPRTA